MAAPVNANTTKIDFISETEVTITSPAEGQESGNKPEDKSGVEPESLAELRVELEKGTSEPDQTTLRDSQEAEHLPQARKIPQNYTSSPELLVKSKEERWPGLEDIPQPQHSPETKTEKAKLSQTTSKIQEVTTSSHALPDPQFAPFSHSSMKSQEEMLLPAGHEPQPDFVPKIASLDDGDQGGQGLLEPGLQQMIHVKGFGLEPGQEVPQPGGPNTCDVDAVPQEVQPAQLFPPAEVQSTGEINDATQPGQIALQPPAQDADDTDDAALPAHATPPPGTQDPANTENGVQAGQNFPMALDVDSFENDSAFGEDVLSSTMSLRSSLYEFVEENGRTYHRYKEGNYWLPNDEIEQSRLDLQHHLFLLTLDGRLTLAPIDNPQHVLDIGTGTGIWAIEYASQHPEAHVTGVDLSPIQPQYVPPNCQFEVNDLDDEWAYSRSPDYIHGRALFTCFDDHKAIFQKAYDVLAPGGYFEMQDIYFKTMSNDGTTDGTPMEYWNNLLIQGAATVGRDWLCPLNYGRWFREVGFEDVVVNKFAWPVNTWPKGRKQKTMGLWMMENAREGMNAISMGLCTRNLGMSAQEVELLLVDVRKDFKDRNIHAYLPVYVVYGRKPGVSEGGD